MMEHGKGFDPLPDTPPEWMPLADLPKWLVEWYQVDRAAITETIDAVWTGDLRQYHRISGLKSQKGQHGDILPSGCEWRRGYHSGSFIDSELVFAEDWAAADVDRHSGTIGGWAKADGTRERLSIELPWKEVRNFVRLRLPRWKRTASAGPAVLLQSMPSPAIKPENGPKRLTKLARIIEALEYLRADKGMNLEAEPNGKLQSLAEVQAKITVSLSTFERAVARVRRPS